MNKLNIVFYACLIILCFISCKKEQNDDGAVLTKNSHRVRQISYFSEDNKVLKEMFTYEGEKLVEIIQYTLTGSVEKEDTKKEISYQGENATEIIYSYYKGWVQNTKKEYSINRGRIDEVSEYHYDPFEIQWKQKSRVLYTYEKDMIVTVETDQADNTGLQPYSRSEYYYDDNRVVECNYFTQDEEDVWILAKRDSFLYNDSRLLGYIEFIKLSYMTEHDYRIKTEYEYSGSSVVGSHGYHWNGSSWIVDEFNYSYEYDANNYLVQINNPDNTITVIDYEEGHGNAVIFVYSPSLHLYGKPQLK